MNIKKQKKRKKEREFLYVYEIIYVDVFVIIVGVPRCRPTLIAVTVISFDVFVCC